MELKWFTVVTSLCVLYGVCVHVYARDLAVSHIETVHHDKACGKLLSSQAEISRSVDCNSCYAAHSHILIILGLIYKIQ